MVAGRTDRTPDTSHSTRGGRVRRSLSGGPENPAHNRADPRVTVSRAMRRPARPTAKTESPIPSRDAKSVNVFFVVAAAEPEITGVAEKSNGRPICRFRTLRGPGTIRLGRRIVRVEQPPSSIFAPIPIQPRLPHPSRSAAPRAAPHRTSRLTTFRVFRRARDPRFCCHRGLALCQGEGS